jgi:hypothetical protein
MTRRRENDAGGGRHAEARTGGSDGEVVRGTNDASRRWVTPCRFPRAARLERWIDGWARGPDERDLRSSRREHEHEREARARREVRTPRNTSLYFASGVTPEAAIAARPCAKAARGELLCSLENGPKLKLPT